SPSSVFYFFFTATPPTETYTLSLHDALPICGDHLSASGTSAASPHVTNLAAKLFAKYPQLTAVQVKKLIVDGSDEKEITGRRIRSEEHTSELQSRGHLVCRLLLEKKKKR